MTEEEMRSKMEFIVEHQARFAAEIQILRESQSELVKAQERSEARMDRMENVVLRLANVVERVAEAQEQTNKNLAETDERLNNLIIVVERYISGHGNGRTEQ